MSEETITYNIVYNVENIDQSIQSTQRMLYFANALRLSIVDIKQVMSGPTLSNIMWTAVQLTRVWTNLYRIIKATNAEQTTTLARGALRGVTSGALAGITTTTGGNMAAVGWDISGAFGAGAVSTGTARMSLMSLLSAFAVANPVVAGGAVAALTVTGLVAYDMRQRKAHSEWRKKQREVAKSQGLEN